VERVSAPAGGELGPRVPRPQHGKPVLALLVKSYVTGHRELLLSVRNVSVNVLITGAGLVGCRTARRLAGQGHQVVLYDIAPDSSYVQSVAGNVDVVRGDIRDLSTLVETMQTHRVETVFHSAYLIGQQLAKQPYLGLRTNLDGSLAIAEAARLTGARRLIFAGSFGIYRWDLSPTSPLTEDFPVGGSQLYRACKIACERVLHAFSLSSGLEFTTVRFAQVYGRGHYAGGDIAGQFLHAALAQALSGQLVEIDPGILGTNDYVYVEDVAQGVALACERPLTSEVYNIGSGRLASAKEVARAVEEAVPGARAVVLEHPRQGPFWVRQQPLDLTRSRNELGYEPRFDVLSGTADFANELRGAS
jgi:UDP-glucose 4-epimerase